MPYVLQLSQLALKETSESMLLVLDRTSLEPLEKGLKYDANATKTWIMQRLVPRRRKVAPAAVENAAQSETSTYPS
jgi:hypothetical protein